ncbi:zinc ABC transporter substrate-binding protein, partial [Bifidobacterium adolescentis]
MKKYMIGLTLAVGMFLLAACGGTNQKDSKKNELTIVTTFYPMYEFT